jgi:hypothetical protein
MTHPDTQHYDNSKKKFFDQTMMNDRKLLKCDTYQQDTTPLVYRYAGAVPKEVWDQFWAGQRKHLAGPTGG